MIEKNKTKKVNKNKKSRTIYIGEVISVGDGIALVEGLPTVQMGELVDFFTKWGVIKGLAVTLNKNFTRIAVLGKETLVTQNTPVKKTYKLAGLPVGPELLGRAVDPIGNIIDTEGPIYTKKRIKSDRKAKGIIYRSKVKDPFLSGIITIDTMIPIGRGQRELIIGDRQMGKTSIALDMIINQNKWYSTKMYCVYVGIGQKKNSIIRVLTTLKQTESAYYTTVISATADDASALQYLAPYSGSSVAEYYRDRGLDALIVLDDLSKHAIAYRQMALLVRRPPGRDAYPGDVFYLHSRLLERGSKLSKNIGGGSLTTFPIIETQGNDVSAYIATNVISITDGQIYVDRKTATKGIWPAINVGASVSRIGSSAQMKEIKTLSSELKIQFNNYKEVEHFVSYATEIDPEIWELLERGWRIIEILKQKRFHPKRLSEELFLLKAVLEGGLDSVPLKDLDQYLNFIKLLARMWEKKGKINQTARVLNLLGVYTVRRFDIK